MEWTIYKIRLYFEGVNQRFLVHHPVAITIDAHTMALPQMKSIWIDEDDDEQKLYGISAPNLVDTDNEDQLGVILINSDKPVLSNRKHIDLPPLPPSAYDMKLSKMHKSKRKRKGLLKLFQSKTSKEEAAKIKISVPFDFSHVSHADSRAGFDIPQLSPTIDPQEQSIVEMSQMKMQKATRPSNDPLVKAFVTDAIPSTYTPRTSRCSSNKRSSVGSSNYSDTRVRSTSTMATSLLNDSNSRMLSKLTSLEKNHLKHKYSKSDSSELDVEFLKNYQFPTLLEEQSVPQISTPVLQKTNADKFQWETPENSAALLETMLLSNEKIVRTKSTPAKSPGKRNSDSILTPILKTSEFLDTPTTRRSVDDVLLCYLQPSEAGSTMDESCSSQFSFARNSVIHYKPN